MKRKKIVWLFAVAIFTFVSVNASVTKSDESIYNAKIDLSKYPNSSAVVLYDYTKIIVNKDLSYKKVRRVVTKVLNYRGKKESSERRIYFDRRFENVAINRSITVKKDNGNFKVIPTDKNAIRLLDAPYESGYMDYAVHKMEVVAFSNVETGDIVDIKYSVNNMKKQPFSKKVFFGYKEPIYKMHYEIVLPKGVKITFNKPDGIIFKDKIVDGKRILTWDATDLPQILSEQNKPENDLIVPTLYVSFYKSWDEFKNGLMNQYNKSIQADSMVENLVNSIVLPTDNKMNKVKKIATYLAKNISSMNVESLEDFKIRSADDVIKSGYAASFDRIALFLSMMKVIGVKGYPVAVGPELLYWNGEKDYIQTEDFQKMIAKIIIGKKEYFVDPSNEFYPIGYTADENRVGLTICSGDIKFVKIKNLKDFSDREEVTYDIVISENGTALITEKHVFWGGRAVEMRKKYKYMTPIQKMQDYQKMLGSISENVEPVSKKMSIDLSYPVKMSFTYKYANYAVREGKFVYFDIPSGLSPFRLIKGPSQRHYSFVSPKNDFLLYDIRIKYPKSLIPIILPKNMNLDKEVFEVSRKIDSGAGYLNIKDMIIEHYGVVTKDNYGTFYKQDVKLSHPRFYKVLLRKRNKFLGIF